MPKHRKFLKSEKAKIKLKGVKLPKGLNVTKTDFKVKKIVIKEQITDTHNPDGTVIRKQNIKELLSKLQHHNASYRNEGIRYLREMLTHHPDEANKQFGAIVHGIAQLSLDIEKDVRKESAKALAILLANTMAETVAPFFDTLSSFLRCAMTHIQLPIQEDSLFMLDNLLLYVPSLVAANSDRIFGSFLDMISKLRVESKPGRTLSINLGSKITSVKWRSKVLDRLLGMLRAMVMAKTKNTKAAVVTNTGGTTTDDASEAFGVLEHATERVNYFHANKPMNFSLIRIHLNVCCDLPLLFGKTLTSVTRPGAFNNEGNRIRHYAELLMPLMFETWMEVRPQQFGHEYNEDLEISNEAAFSLKTILEIIERIYELIVLWDAEMNNSDLADWFRATYNKEFCAQIFVAFPYSQGDGFKGSKRKSKGVPVQQDVQDAGGQKCYPQNLSIAHLFCALNSNVSRAYASQAQKVTAYLTKIVHNLQNANAETSTALIKVLRAVLLEHGANWLPANVGTQKLLTSSLAAYQQQKFAKDIRTKVLVLLCDIVLNVSLCQLYGNELFTDWLVTLPVLLCQPFVSHHVLTTFSCLAKQQNRMFLDNLKAHVPDIIANLPKIQIVGIDDQFEGIKSIINLFYWLDPLHWQPPPADATQQEATSAHNYIQQIVMLKQQNRLQV